MAVVKFQCTTTREDGTVFVRSLTLNTPHVWRGVAYDKRNIHELFALWNAEPAYREGAPTHRYDNIEITE